ncbi:MAG: hypothetical protein ACJASX_001277 [Limisphaerales bacterium]|jgi:hypothetical protein
MQLIVAIAVQIAVTQIIAEYHDEIGTLIGSTDSEHGRQTQHEKDTAESDHCLRV